jgi:hypothetical protein
MFPYLVQGSNIIVVIGSKTHTINKQHLSYSKIVDAIKANDWTTVQDLIEPKKAILSYGAGNVSIQGDKIFWKDEEFSNYLADKIVTMFQEGFPIEPLVLFMENLMSNPSKRAVSELYRFLEKGQMPITSDGHFLAYKRVRANYTDVHSGKFDNSVGKIVEMERNKVDDDKDRTCSTGLHFCSEEYLKHFSGERIMILKINPRDVVSIPSDYNDSKGRCCRYEVIGELNKEDDAKEAFTDSVQDNGFKIWIGVHD